MSFDEILDLTADVLFILYYCRVGLDSFDKMVTTEHKLPDSHYLQHHPENFLRRLHYSRVGVNSFL